MSDATLDLGIAHCCAADLVLESQTVLETDMIDATSMAMMDLNLIINSDKIGINAPIVSIFPGVDMNGTFNISSIPSCP